MPRGEKGTGAPRRRKSIEDKIADLDRSIEAHKNTIAELTNQKKVLIGEREREKTQELLKVMEASGMTADELIELVKVNADR